MPLFVTHFICLPEPFDRCGARFPTLVFTFHSVAPDCLSLDWLELRQTVDTERLEFSKRANEIELLPLPLEPFRLFL